MTAKAEVLQRITGSGIVAVVRANGLEQAVKISEACISGGVDAIEITFTVPGADEVIRALKKRFPRESLLVGAGTVLDPETARIAISSGAEFVVGPSFNIDTARLCNRYQVPYMPGCMTVTEIITAMEAGADIIKIFPGDLFGPRIIKDVRGPLPQASLMPTGGVSLQNVHEWINAGAAAVGVGSDLTAGAKRGDYDEVTRTARQFVEAIKAARGAA